MGQLKNHGVCEKVPLTEATNSGAKLITTRWVDINKGDDEYPKNRGRLVARELSTHDETGPCDNTTTRGGESFVLDGDDKQ